MLQSCKLNCMVHLSNSPVHQFKTALNLSRLLDIKLKAYTKLFYLHFLIGKKFTGTYRYTCTFSGPEVLYKFTEPAGHQKLKI